MKDYTDMAESVLKRRKQYYEKRRSQAKKLTVGVFSFCICALFGIGVWQSGLFQGVPEENIILQDDSTVGSDPTQWNTLINQDVTQKDPVETSASSEDKLLISTDEGLSVSPFRGTDLTEEALYDAVGAYLPTERPDGFFFESASSHAYGYSAIWYCGYNELDWYVRDYEESDAVRITDIEDIKNYDLSLYPIPWAESVPEELMEIVDNPIFRAEELTLDAVYARAYKIDDIGDEAGYRMRFSVLYGDKLVTIASKGVDPDWIYNQLSTIKERCK